MITGNHGKTNISSNRKPKPFEFKPDPTNPYPACKEAIQKAKLYKEVFEVLHPWTLSPENQSNDLSPAIELVNQCYHYLNRDSELDAYLEKVVKVHSKNWRVLKMAASIWDRKDGWGTIRNGVFIRGDNNGRQVYSYERDHVRALRLMTNAMKILEKDLETIQPGFFRDRVAKYNEQGYFTQKDLDLFARNGDVNLQQKKLLDEAVHFYRFFATLFSREYWKLQILTDLSQLPDYLETRNYENNSGIRVPVDSRGNLVFYDLPNSFEEAKNDGERQRFLWHQMTLCSPNSQDNEWMSRARSLIAIFGVDTLQRYRDFFGKTGSVYGDSYDSSSSSDSEKKSETSTGIWDLQTLDDNETIAQLATGIKRFKFPEDQNFISLLKKILQFGGPNRLMATHMLAEEYKNRRQYTKAAEVYRQQIKLIRTRNVMGNPSVGKISLSSSLFNLKKLETNLQQIVGNWGQFEPTRNSAAGEKQKLAYRFRNGSSVNFKVRRINIEAFLTDIKEYLKSLESGDNKLDYQRIDLNALGNLFVNNKQKQKKYLGETVAEWSLDLNPAKGHCDKRILIDLPVTEGGAYFIESKMADGNRDTVVAWLDDFALVTKDLDRARFYYVADAATGKPIPNVEFDFFGYAMFRSSQNKKSVWRTKEYQGISREDGEFVIKKEDWDVQEDNRREWLVIASKMINGRKHLAFLGFSPFWFAQRNESQFERTRAYFISDRPVYRPNQEVKFKFWAGKTNYESSELTDWGGRKVLLTIDNPRGETILKKYYVLDSYGGLSDKITLDQSAPLGSYHFQLKVTNSNFIQNLSESDYDVYLGNGSIRLEEYKKPEYEVTVKTPEAPVRLGDKIKVTVEAKYYFGAPVTNAKVNYKILRKKHSANWYPIRPWDWFYGNGYAWFAPDASWYPGWKIWGCPAPIGSWYPRRWETPEVITQESGTIDSDGKFEIEINTESAKILYPDDDQKYDIEVEVIDQSRRTIRGNGTVLVAPNSFKVYTCLDRGFYKPNDQLNATVQARRIDGKPVSGQAVIKIFHIEYVKNSKIIDNSKESRSAIQPIETEIYRSSLMLQEEGSGTLSLKAPKSGQYRLSCVVTDANGCKIEGGNLFSVRASGEQVTSDLHFNDIELITEKAEYAPGETARLLINTDQKDATVLLFLRSVNGICNPPQTIRMNGQTKIVEVRIEKSDMPNFFIEALTVSNGRVFTAQKELFVPPEKKILNLTIVPSKEKYRPGEKAKADLLVTDLQNKPVCGQLVVSIYDKSVEYISGGYNLEDIKKFFWTWRRLSKINYTTNLYRIFRNITPDEITMTRLGIYDDLLLEQEEGQNDGIGENGYRKKRAFSAFTGSGKMDVMSGTMLSKNALVAAAPAVAAAPVADASPSLMKTNSDSVDFETDTVSESDKVMIEPTVRKNFADTAFWTATLETDQKGKAQIELAMPENLTTWKIRAWSIASGTRVGEGSTEILTGKDLIIRMQKPRFLIQGDHAVFSANVHNYLSTEKEVEVALKLPHSSQVDFKTDSNDKSQMDFKDKSKTDQALLVLNGKEKSVHRIKIGSQAEQRIDWHLTAKQTGTATVQMFARTDEESDALEETIPVYVHGILKQEAISGMIAARLSQKESETNVEKTVSANFTMTVPEKRRPEESILTVRFSPTLAGAMLDAIPYLTDYPYGCTEQTLNRFVPTLIARRTLQNSGIDLKALAKKRTNLNAQELGNPQDRVTQWKHLKKSDQNPVFDEKIVLEMTAQGLKKLEEMQCSDGGWGWFSGVGEYSSAHLTAQVVHGLILALSCDVNVNQHMIKRGINWLINYQKEQAKKLLLGEILTTEQKSRSHFSLWKESPDDLDAFVFSVLAEALPVFNNNYSVMTDYPTEINIILDNAEANRKKEIEQKEIEQNKDRQNADYQKENDANGDYNQIEKVLNKNLDNVAFASCYMKNRLWNNRVELSRLSISLFGLGLLAENDAMKQSGDQQRNIRQHNDNDKLIDDLIRMLAQYVKEDPENQTAYLDLGTASHYWWRWYGNDIETQAHFLKLLASRNPQSEIAPRLVKYLLNNRKNAIRWNSTRDTAYCLEAFAKYLSATKELDPKTTVEVLIDGQIQKKIDINADNLFLINNTVEWKGTMLRSGKHEICLRQTGTGPLYYNAYLQNFTLEDSIKKTGLEVKVTRNYYRLIEKKDAKQYVADARGGVYSKRIEKWERTLLREGAEVKSGDLIEVELLVTSKNDYDSILIEDRKPAGMEPVELRSGYNGNSLGAYVEYRDERVCFFVRQLKKGSYAVSYRMKAEQPGQFSALPATIWGMYAPELKGNADEFKVKISD